MPAETVKKFACKVWELYLIPGLERSPGERRSGPLQYFCLENSMDRGAWWARVHGAPRLLQFSSVTQSRPTLCNFMDYSMPGFPVHHQSQSLLKLMSIELWCHPNISSSVVSFSSHLQSFPASGSFPVSQYFASGGQSIECVSFSISPSSEYSRLISFRMGWLDLLAVQGTLKSLLQHHSSKASFLGAQLSL